MRLLPSSFGLALSVASLGILGRDESYTMLVGKRRDREVEGNEIAVPLTDANGARAELIMRAHEDGVALRYHLLGEGTSQVTSESTGFAIPAGARALLRPYDGGDVTFVTTAGAYEQPPEILPVGAAIEATGFAFPTLFARDLGTYIMITEGDLDRSYCGTRLDEMPEENLYRIRFAGEHGWEYVLIDGAVFAAYPFVGELA